MSRRGLVQVVVAGAAAFAIFIGLGLTVDLSGRGVALTQPLASGNEPTAVPKDGPLAKGEQKGLAALRCFRCHNIERYRNGEDFSHEAHEDVGHCHVCHAFQGHFQAVIRRQVCEDCH